MENLIITRTTITTRRTGFVAFGTRFRIQKYTNRPIWSLFWKRTFEIYTRKPSLHISIGVGAQSTLGGTTFLPETYVWKKISKCPNFTWFLLEKLSKYPNFMIIARKIIKLTKFHNFTRFLPEKMPEFFIIIGRKIFFPNLGGHVPPPPSPCPPSPTPIHISKHSLVCLYKHCWRTSDRAVSESLADVRECPCTGDHPRCLLGALH